MKLLERDLEQFRLYKPIFVTDSDGCITTEYQESSITFKGHLQPVETNHATDKYSTNKAYVNIIFSQYILFTHYRDLVEKDKITNNNSAFIISGVKRWKTYCEITLEQVKDGH